MKAYTQLLQRLSQDSMSLESFERFWRDVGEEEAYTDTATRLELLRLYDFPLHQDGDTLTLSTASLPLQEAVFCFVGYNISEEH